MGLIIGELIGFSIIPILLIIAANKKSKKGKLPIVIFVVQGMIAFGSIIGPVTGGSFSDTDIPMIIIAIVTLIISVVISLINYKKFKANENTGDI